VLFPTRFARMRSMRLKASMRHAVAVAVLGLLAIAGLTAVTFALDLPGKLDPGPAPGRVLFSDDFTSGLGRYDVIHPERVSIVPDPTGRPRQVAKFTVLDWDIGPTPNPRAQIASDLPLRPGRTVWIGWSSLFPRSFPPVIPGWLTFASLYGPPFENTGPVTFQVVGREIRWQRNRTYGWRVAWRMPLIRGRWVDFVIHTRLSRDPRRGFVELWVNTGDGWRQQLLQGRRRLVMQTLDSSNGGGVNQHRIGSYRKRGMFRSVTTYGASHRIGTGFEAVAPHSYG
jgi:Polysaccharide lyase